MTFLTLTTLDGLEITINFDHVQCFFTDPTSNETQVIDNSGSEHWIVRESPAQIKTIINRLNTPVDRLPPSH
jgi:hypothetical protein